EWIDNDRLLLTITMTTVPLGVIGTPEEWGMLQTYDLSTHQPRALLGQEDKTLNVVLGPTMVRQIGGHTSLYVAGIYVRARQLLPGLFRIDAASGDEELVVKGAPDARAWLVDDLGNVVAEQQYRNDARSSVFSIRRDGLLREVAAVDDPFE